MKIFYDQVEVKGITAKMYALTDSNNSNPDISEFEIVIYDANQTILDTLTMDSKAAHPVAIELCLEKYISRLPSPAWLVVNYSSGVKGETWNSAAIACKLLGLTDWSAFSIERHFESDLITVDLFTAPSPMILSPEQVNAIARKGSPVFSTALAYDLDEMLGRTTHLTT